MIVLVPLSRFRAQYETACGRPYSTLERLTLRAIANGATSVDHLSEQFRVHPRLLVEAVVTLVREGWVAVGGSTGSGFLLTAEGTSAVSADETPDSLVISERTTYVLMERITGALIPSNEVRFVTRRDLGDRWDLCVRLRVEVSDNAVDEGQVQTLLPRRKDEWLRWVGPIDMVSKSSHWLPVNVDAATKQVVGLPDSWRARLRDLIVDEALRHSNDYGTDRLAATFPIVVRTSAGRDERADVPRVPASTWATNLEPSDILFTDREHDEYLRRALQQAKTNVLIASAFLNTGRLEALAEQILAALVRGVNCDLLWGYAATRAIDGAGVGDSVARMKKLAYQAKQLNARGTLRFNSAASSSHAKLLLWDNASGYEACVGSYNWLSVAAELDSTDPRNVSVRLTHPEVVAAFSRSAAAFWSSSQGEILASTGDRWRRVATDLESLLATKEPTSDANCRVRIVIDRDHEAVLREFLSTSQFRMLVVSHRLGPAAEARLVAGSRSDRATGFDYRVIVGMSELEEDAKSRILAEVQRCGGAVMARPRCHAKVLVADSSATISSYNFLSSDPFGTATAGRELGVVLDCPEAADWLWQRFVAL